MGHKKQGQCSHAQVENALRVLGHASILKWVVDATIVLLAQFNTKEHVPLLLCIIAIFKLPAGGT